MAYRLERIGPTGAEKIHKDLQKQPKYKNTAIENFLQPNPDRCWAIDESRNRYLHSIRQFFPTNVRIYHFFMDGCSYEIEIPEKLCREEYLATVTGTSTAETKEILADKLGEIQEAFDVYGMYGGGPDLECSPGFFRVVLTLTCTGV